MPDPATSPALCLRLFLENWQLGPDAPNKTRGQHWAKRARRAKLAKAHVLAALASPALRTARSRWPGRSPVEIRTTAYLTPRARPLDPDNATAALKPLIDALVFHGVMRDDTEEHVRIAPVAFVSARERRAGEIAGVELLVLAADGGSEAVALGR